MNVRVLVAGAVVLVVGLVAGTVMWRDSNDDYIFAIIMTWIGAYVAMYGLAVKPSLPTSSLRAACGSIGPRAMVFFGLGHIPFSVFVLYLGWALMETGWIDNPLSWLTLLFGFALGVFGLWLFFMGIAGKEEKVV